MVPQVEAKHQAALNLSLKSGSTRQEKHYLIQQLEACEGKINLVARSAGIDVKTLYRKMRQYGLDKRLFKHQGRKIRRARQTFL
jgi:transcriptional regulator of acetoin/glycerol metabolism